LIIERFRQVALFADLEDDDLARVCAEADEVRLAPGEVLFREGEGGDRAFIVTSGELDVLKKADDRDVLIAVRGEDQMIGELALLEETSRSATVRARTTVDLVSIPKSALDDLLATSPAAARTIFIALLRRAQETNDRLRHQERMAQLGVMTAGIAHELNNPASAVQRAAEHLSGDLELLTSSLDDRLASPEVHALLTELDDRSVAGLSPVELSDEEAALEEWLDAQDVADSWSLAPTLVEAGVRVDDLDRLIASRDLASAVGFLATAASVRRSAAQIAEGARRLSGIVGALRSYSYLDRGPVQEVDVVRGIEDTLVLLGHATKGVRIVREFDPELPAITGFGAELNQVWTNLIHNACDALAETADPTLTLRAAWADGSVVVEVQDNGPGIPAELHGRIFDAFFTTKEPGKGTGLGLQISYHIVVMEHSGDLELESQPGSTTFRVTLPIEPPAAETAAPEAPLAEDVTCEHLERVDDAPKPPGGCAGCIEQGDPWVHLRFCVTCGRIGCCNDSRNQHALKHARDSGHPVIRTKEPGENWAWCFVHEIGIDMPAVDSTVDSAIDSAID
jgi:signal transduction histidine kinase